MCDPLFNSELITAVTSGTVIMKYEHNGSNHVSQVIYNFFKINHLQGSEGGTEDTARQTSSRAASVRPSSALTTGICYTKAVYRF
jgi:hypothetical protein